MYQINHLEDTIVAIATPPGQGAIGIVRLSGKNTLAICDQLFVSKNKKKPSEFKSFSAHYGWVVGSPGRPRLDESSIVAGPPEIIDEALLTLMRSPKSYTTEDVAEISCHGGMVALYAIVQLIVGLGARLAEPGEFTK